MKRERIDSLDGLKGIACLIIALLWHYLNMQPKGMGMPLQSLFGIFYDYGQYFVELFFMISGFVMAYCYKDKIDGGMDFLPYMGKRLKHLYPLFFTTLLCVLVLQVLYNALTGSFYVYQVSVWHFILNVLCIQSGWFTTDQSFNGPAWCISVEIFLYILFYISTKLSKKDRNAYVIISGIIFVCSTILVYRNNCNYPILNMFMMRGVSCFYAGVLICELNDWLDKSVKEKLSITAFILFVLFRIVIHFSTDFSFWENEDMGRMALILLEWPILIFTSINLSWLRRVLEIGIFKFLGAISMDVFLWHIPIQISIKSVDEIFGLNINYGSKWIWGMYALLVLGVSVVSNFVSKKENKKHYLIKGIVAIMCCVIALMVLKFTGLKMSAVLNNSMSYSDHAATITMDPGVSLSEEFYMDEDTKLQKLQFYTITWNKVFANDQLLQITIRNKDTNEILYQTSRWMSLFRDGNYYELEVDEPVNFFANTWYVISFDSNTQEEQERMALMLTNKTNSEGTVYVNGQELEHHISTKIWTRK